MGSSYKEAKHVRTNPFVQTMSGDRLGVRQMPLPLYRAVGNQAYGRMLVERDRVDPFAHAISSTDRQVQREEDNAASNPVTDNNQTSDNLENQEDAVPASGGTRILDPSNFQLTIEREDPGLHFDLGLSLGASTTLGTHTVNLQNQLGLSSRLRYNGWQLGVDASTVSGIFGRQWAFDFPAVENQSSLAFLMGHRLLSAGLQLDWFNNRSFAELGGGAVPDDERFFQLQQRLGTFFLQSDFEAPDGCFHGIRVSLGNDSRFLLGDGEDHFRTAQAAINYMLQFGQLQLRTGVAMDLFTGDVDHSRVVETPDGPFVVNQDLFLADRSQGLISVELGASYFLPHERGLSEFGISLFGGPDTEGIRNTLQNRFVHRGILDAAQIPLVDRPDRFQFDVRLFYTYRFGFSIR